MSSSVSSNSPCPSSSCRYRLPNSGQRSTSWPYHLRSSVEGARSRSQRSIDATALLNPHGERLDLTPTEYKLLYHLVRNAGHVLQHGTLLAKVWGREYVDEVDYIRVYIRRLRDKLGDDPDSPRYIRTERGLGYRFVADGSS